ncbi:MAG: methylmalonyl-CoA epimerase [Bacteroidetes bacterium]|nr:methylmalonyl-CoA epimerase [Bacteroidota bacterium]
MFRKIEHIGIAVKNLDAANAMFGALSQLGLLKTEEVETEGVRTSFFKLGETKIEFLEATNSESPIAKFIEKHGEGIHHIAFDVEDVEAEKQRLQDAGFEFISTEIKKGADNKLICFLHPRSVNRVLVELCQENL